MDFMDFMDSKVARAVTPHFGAHPLEVHVGRAQLPATTSPWATVKGTHRGPVGSAAERA